MEDYGDRDFQNLNDEIQEYNFYFDEYLFLRIEYEKEEQKPVFLWRPSLRNWKGLEKIQLIPKDKKATK